MNLEQKEKVCAFCNVLFFTNYPLSVCADCVKIEKPKTPGFWQCFFVFIFSIYLVSELSDTLFYFHKFNHGCVLVFLFSIIIPLVCYQVQSQRAKKWEEKYSF